MLNPLRYLLCLLVLFLPACQTPAGSAGDRIAPTLERVADALDRNQDGQLTNREIRDSKNDPMVWLNVGGALLGLLGVAGATKANKSVDQLWDVTHKPAVPPAA